MKNTITLLEKERNALRKIVDITMDCIIRERRGHTQNWKKVYDLVEKYEDDYSPVGDNL